MIVPVRVPRSLGVNRARPKSPHQMSHCLLYRLLARLFGGVMELVVPPCLLDWQGLGGYSLCPVCIILSALMLSSESGQGLSEESACNSGG